MTTNHHTPITPGAAANASTFNAPMGELDAAIQDHEVRITDLENNEITFPGIASEFLNGQGQFAVPAGTGSTNGHVIQANGVDKTQRAKLNFKGSGVAVVDSPTATEVQITSGGHTIQDEGISVTDRTILNFVGGGVTVTDDAGNSKTVVTIPSGITDHGALTGLGDDDHPQYLLRTEYLAPSAPNLLINGGFDFFQRQVPGTATLMSNSAYWADRWKLQFNSYALYAQRLDGTQFAELTSRWSGRLITQAGGGDKFIFFQILEGTDSVPLRGKTVSFQIKMRCPQGPKTMRMGILELQNAGTIDTIPSTLVTNFNSAGVDPTFGANIAKINAESKTVTASWQTFTVNATVPATSKNIIVAMWADSNPGANVAYDMGEAGLYLGTATQVWRPESIQEVLVKCSRFYEKTYNADVAPGTSSSVGVCISYVAVTGNKSVTPSLPFTAPKRTTPTVICYTIEGVASNIGEYDASGTLVGNRAQGVSASEKNFFYYTGANCTAGNTMRFHWVASCEL